MTKSLTHLGDVSVETFLRDYWQQKPLLIRQAFPDFKSPIDANDLAGLSLEEEVESRLILEEGSTPWELRCGPFDETDYQQLPNSHWTLLVQAVDHYVPEVNQLLEAFRFLPDWRLDDIMVSYATTGGSVGPHFDQYDVFLLQGAGQRHWQVGQWCDENSPLLASTPLSILEEFSADQDFTLAPGDMLYLPPKLAHWGRALDDDCLTYSIGFRAPSHAEILEGLTQDVITPLSEFHRFQDRARALSSQSGRIESSDVEQILALWRDSLTPELAASWLGRYMTQPKYGSSDAELSETTDSTSEIDNYNPTRISINGLAEALPEHVQKHPASRFAFHLIPPPPQSPPQSHLQPHADAAEFFVAGKSHTCSRLLAEYLCSQHRYSTAELLSLVGRPEAPEQDQQLISYLWQRQHIEDPDQWLLDDEH